MFVLAAIVGIVLIAGLVTIVLSVSAMFPDGRGSEGVLVGLLPAAVWAGAIYAFRNTSFAVVALVALGSPVVFAVATSRWHRF